MIIINKNNFKRIVQLGLIYENAVQHNSECFSTSDVLREIEAKDNVDKILSLLVKAGVDIETELKDLTKNTGINFFNGANFVKKEEDFSIKYKLSSFERFVSKHEADLIDEDEAIISKNNYYSNLEIDSTRFSYEAWDTSRESIEYLKDYCNVFKSLFVSIEENFKTSSNFKITEIHCIRDTVFNDDVNLSQYVIHIEDEENKDNLVLVQAFINKKDLVVYNNKTKVIKKVIQSDKLNSHIINNDNLDNKVNKLLLKVDACKQIMMAS